MQTHAIKGIVTDVDGTLTSYDRRAYLPALEALRKVHDMKFEVILATGNVLPIAYAYYRIIGLSGPVIAENGGILFHNHKVEYLNSIQEAQRAYDFLRRQMKVERLFTDRWRVTEIALEPVEDIGTVRRLLKEFRVNVESSGFAVHIASSNSNKFTALQKACSMIGLDMKELAVFGDSYNDIEMFRGCGIRVAVANAPQELKEISDYVTKGTHGEGFVEGLQWLGLI